MCKSHHLYSGGGRLHQLWRLHQPMSPPTLSVLLKCVEGAVTVEIPVIPERLVRTAVSFTGENVLHVFEAPQGGESVVSGSFQILLGSSQ